MNTFNNNSNTILKKGIVKKDKNNHNYITINGQKFTEHHKGIN